MAKSRAIKYGGLADTSSKEFPPPGGVGEGREGTGRWKLLLWAEGELFVTRHADV